MIKHQHGRSKNANNSTPDSATVALDTVWCADDEMDSELLSCNCFDAKDPNDISETGYARNTLIQLCDVVKRTSMVAQLP